MAAAGPDVSERDDSLRPLALALVASVLLYQVPYGAYVLYPFKLLGTYGWPFWNYAALDAASWPDKCTFVMISLVVTGLLTVLEWDALQLGPRDCLALGALPVRSRTGLGAKLAMRQALESAGLAPPDIH